MPLQEQRESEFFWVENNEDHQHAVGKVCRKWGRPHQETGGAWITKPFNSCKTALEKMGAHTYSKVHIQFCVTLIAADTAVHQASVSQHLQQVPEGERLKNREAIKPLISSTRILTHNSIAHATSFGDLVELVASNSLKMQEEMPHTHPKMQSWNLLQQLVKLLKNCFPNTCPRHSIQLNKKLSVFWKTVMLK